MAVRLGGHERLSSVLAAALYAAEETTTAVPHRCPAEDDSGPFYLSEDVVVHDPGIEGPRDVRNPGRAANTRKGGHRGRSRRWLSSAS